MPHGFSWATLIFGPEGAGGRSSAFGLVTDQFQIVPLFHALLAALILMAAVVIVRINAKAKGDDILPDPFISVRNLIELGVEWLMGLMEEIIGPHYRKYTPLVMGTFFYILIVNMFGLIPFFAPATDKWSVTISMALVIFLATHIYGIAAHGIGYFKHFISPVWPPSAVLWGMSIIYLPIELISHAARVLSLSLRLMANMMADHTVLTIFLMLTAPLVPVIFTGLGVMVCLIQAFIFTVLSIVYIGMAVHHEDEHAEEHH